MIVSPGLMIPCASHCREFARSAESRSFRVFPGSESVKRQVHQAEETSVSITEYWRGNIYFLVYCVEFTILFLNLLENLRPSILKFLVLGSQPLTSRCV